MDLRIMRVRPEGIEEAVAVLARDVYGGDVDEAWEHLADHATGGGDSFLAYVQNPLPQGERASMDHDLILWLTKDLAAGPTPSAPSSMP